MRSTPHLPTELWVKIIELRIDDCFRQPFGGKREAQLKELMAARQVSSMFTVPHRTWNISKSYSDFCHNNSQRTLREERFP